MNSYCKLSFIIVISAILFLTQTIPAGDLKVDNKILEKNDLYHIGWVWPDSLPQLQSDVLMDEDGMLYAIDEKGTIYCFKDNGEIVWTYRGDYKYASSLMCVTKESILFMSSDRKHDGNSSELNCLDRNGRFRWKFSGARRLYYKSFKSQDDELFIAAGDHDNYGWGKITGYYKITPDGNGEYFDWPVKGRITFWGIDGHDRLVISDSSNTSLMFLSSDGLVLHSLKAADSHWKVTASLTFTDERFYLIDDTRTVFAYDYNFKLLWTYKLGGDLNEYLRNILYINNNQDVILQSRTGRIHLLNKNNGKIFWQNDLESYITATYDILPLANGNILVVGDRATLSVLDNSGKLIWHHTMYDGGNLYDPLELPSSDFFITQAGRLYRFTADKSQTVPEMKPVPPPSTLAEAEQEIISYVLDHVVEDAAPSLGEFIEETNQDGDLPPLAPPHENLVVYYPRTRGTGMSQWGMNYKKPIKVWLNIGSMLEEQTDKQAAIDDYKKRNEEDSFMPWSYGKYYFCIISITDNFQKAEIQLDYHCGGLCGHGDRLTLQRTPSGKWWVVDISMSWIS